MLNDVPGGYASGLHDGQGDLPCGSEASGDLLDRMRSFEPGRQRLRVTRVLSKDRPECVWQALFIERAEQFRMPLPGYRFIAWSPANDHLGMGRRSCGAIADKAARRR